MPDEASARPESKAAVWPYTSWKTILNTADKFKGALPPRIDRSALGGSEGQKSQVMSTLKFVGFTSDSGDVTPLFQSFVSDEKNRPALMKSVLERCYPEAVKLGSVNGTTAQLAETF